MSLIGQAALVLAELRSLLLRTQLMNSCWESSECAAC